MVALSRIERHACYYAIAALAGLRDVCEWGAGRLTDRLFPNPPEATRPHWTDGT